MERAQVYREAFLAQLNQHLAAPSSEWPTVRCWTKKSLTKLFQQVREELALTHQTSHLSHTSLLAWLDKLHLATRIPIGNEILYLLEIGASNTLDVPPNELLLACKPAGVVCYFSAVAFHGLTTQMVEHHHVAERRSEANMLANETVEAAVPDPTEQPRTTTRQHRLGTLMFHYQGTPYYSTRRSERLLPGIQMRYNGPRSQVRITTLEQTLLDALAKPFHCGGPEVVFEAWHEGCGSRRLDEERLVAYLQAMNYPATTRRLGVMFEIVGYNPGTEMRCLLQASQEAIDRQSPHARIALLPGIAYPNLHERWLVSTP